MLQLIKQTWQRQMGEDETPLDGDTPAFVLSFLLHLAAMVAIGAIPMAQAIKPVAILVTQTPLEEQEELTELNLPQEFHFSDLPSEDVGANSISGTLMAFSEAPNLSESSNVPIQHDLLKIDTDATIEINNTVIVPTALHVNHNVVVRGAAGHGETGAVGAIDRLTHEILLSLEERKTLVVWLFDQTASLIPQRKAIHDRFGKIYEELGIIEASGHERFKREDRPLLSSIISFGDDVKLLTKKPTESLSELRAAVANMPDDASGNERIFQAVSVAVKEYMHYRVPPSESREPERNVMIVAFTDEGGTDQEFVDPTVKLCRRYGMPVYVIGVPAPFGRRETEMKWVDPDPKYDQMPKWGVVEQGPESLMPERLKLSFSGTKEDEAQIDSGFGPFALTRLCNETGGIYFAVHPNRDARREVSRRETQPYSAYLQRFFDPEIMRRYKPDYVSLDEYKKRLGQNKARAALVHAATFSNVTPMEDPTLRFVKRDEATFGNSLSAAQQAAAKLEPKVATLYEALKAGEQDRNKETSARWQAGYDLAMGRVLAVKVRTETYNAMLATAKRGLPFKDPKNNTWVLAPSNEVSVGSQMQKLADQAKTYLERVVKDHPDTPWALLAQRKLKDPIGWKWTETLTPTPAMIAAARPPATPAPPRPPAPPAPPPANRPPPPPSRPLPKL